MRPLYLSFSLLSTLIVASATFEFPWLSGSQRWIRSIFSNDISEVKIADLERDLVQIVSRQSQSPKKPALECDQSLRSWLIDATENGVTDTIDELSAAIQKQFPQYVNLAVTRRSALSASELIKNISDTSVSIQGGFTHHAIVARARNARLGFECVIVLGERLPEFKPELISTGHDRFYIVCPICRKGQACEIPAKMRSVNLVCPNCSHHYAMLAVDTKGRYHHVSSYLTGYAPPSHFPKGVSKIKEMLQIWNSVVRNIRYLQDNADGNPDNDAWQTAYETQKLGTGDCEDSAIYLADWLTARGFEARVAVGHYAERGGHAWVVVRLEGNSYLLETTNLEIDTTEPPLAAEAGCRYVPNAMIDRTGFYVRRDSTQTWDGDYWSSNKWEYIPTPLDPSAHKMAATVIQENR